MINSLKIYSSFLMVFVLSSAYAQPNPNVEEKPYIEVTGIAEQEVVPDEIYVNIEIREQKAKTSLEDQEEKLKTIISDLGLSFSDLSLSDANTDYMKVRLKSGTIKMGKSYSLKVKDAATVGKLFYRLDKDEVAEANIERLDYSRMDSLKRAMRIAAIKAAKAKADYLMEAIGQKAGKPLVVRETEPDIAPMPNQTRYKYTANATYEEYNSKWKQEVVFEKMQVRSSIYIKFAIQ